MAGLKQKQSLSHSLSPQQILQTLILQLNSTSLEQKVIDELESNPLLDQPESIQENDEEELKEDKEVDYEDDPDEYCLLYTSPSPRDATLSRMPSSA
mgnify:CR=1 FL=1